MTSLRKDAIELLEHRSENTSIEKEKAFERLEQLSKKVPDMFYSAVKCIILLSRINESERFTEVRESMTEEMIRKAVLSFVTEYPIKKVALFGSRALGTNQEDSDVDLIMEFSAPISLLTLSEIQCQLEDMLNLDVDVIHGPIRDTDLIEVGKEIELYAA